MSETFKRAYCIELEEFVSPYTARKLYFNTNSEVKGQKLNFICPEENCNVELVAVSITKNEYIKPPHFRIKKSEKHNIKCFYHVENIKKREQEAKRVKKEGKKEQEFPMVFKLEGFTKKIAGIEVVDEYDDNDDSVKGKVTKPRTNREKNRNSVSKTSVLKNIVDCYKSGTKEQNNEFMLEIAGKIKSYNSFFKRLGWYFQEKGLIYYSEISEIKKYNTGYLIKFEDYQMKDKKKVNMNMFLFNDLIEVSGDKYEYENLLNSDKKLELYFVGAWPELKLVKTDKCEFEVFEIEINNLNHLYITEVNKKK
ncbi:MAG: hypothetical protein JW924_12295 [Fusobacteriaceae bacterium]|nr:hypothetical protein [Fusobacteriaceae bacterium]